MKKYVLIACVILLGACSSISIPVSGITSDGQEWTGYFTIKEFTLAGDNTICIGKTPKSIKKENEITFECEDGRSGIAKTKRTSLSGGIAKILLSDGTTGNFTYGS